MFHKVKAVYPLPETRLSVEFVEGVTKIYDVKPLLQRWDRFQALVEDPSLFEQVAVDVGGYGVVWNDELDLSCDELFAEGETVLTPFDGLMSFGDASSLWGLNESTLRKAISYGKLVNGVDVRKFGKQWVVATDAMRREYGTPTR